MNKASLIILVLVVIFLISMISSRLFSDTDFKIENKIAVIPIYGEISVSGESVIPFEVTGSPSTIITEFIKKADEDASVKAIILEINSPGGSVVASEEIANAVKFSKKPTVAWIREVGASGAYWIASSSDKIVADPMSITGSVGVIGSYLQFSELFEKYGITYERLVSGEYKDTGSPFRELTDEERRLLQNKIDKIDEYFTNQVKENRNLTNVQVQKISNGEFFLGVEAKDLGLVDELGGKEQAVEIAKKLANIKEAKLVSFKKKTSILDLLTRINSINSFYIGKGFGYGMYERIKLEGLNFQA